MVADTQAEGPPPTTTTGLATDPAWFKRAVFYEVLVRGFEDSNKDGTGDYQGSDCGHGGAGAAHDGGDVTWAVDRGKVVISGVVLNGLPGPDGTPGFPTTVTVPAAYGHYTGTLGSFIILPPFIPSGIGSSQLQVAP